MGLTGYDDEIPFAPYPAAMRFCWFCWRSVTKGVLSCAASAPSRVRGKRNLIIIPGQTHGRKNSFATTSTSLTIIPEEILKTQVKEIIRLIKILNLFLETGSVNLFVIQLCASALFPLAQA